MRILVTRPREDAGDLVRWIEAQGHTAIVAPLMSVTPETVVDLDLTGVQALLVTSRNALRALASSQALAAARHLPLLAVGKATSDLALTLGFTHVRTGRGDGRGLAEMARASLDASQGALLHLSGENIAFDLAAALEPDGFAVRRHVVYRMVPAEALPGEVADELRAGRVDAVLVMSPATADIYVTLAMAAGLAAAARSATYLCMSVSVAQRFEPLAPVRVKIAVQPTTEEMLALVGELAAELG